jgi:hypothetical protein
MNLIWMTSARYSHPFTSFYLLFILECAYSPTSQKDRIDSSVFFIIEIETLSLNGKIWFQRLETKKCGLSISVGNPLQSTDRKNPINI